MSVVNVLPPNATQLEKAIISAFLNQLSKKENVIRTLFNPDCCPDEFLPYLASFLSVDFSTYNKVCNTKKRLMIKNSIDLHRKKGTLGALKKALDTIDYQLSVREWYEYHGIPHTFSVDITVDANKNINSDLVSIKHLIDTNKNVQSAYQFNLINPLHSKIVSGGVTKAKHRVYLKGAVHV